MINNGVYWKRYRWRGLWIIYKIVLYRLVNNTGQVIKVESNGASDADYRHVYGCYMVKFTYPPYNLQKNKKNIGKSLSLVNY